MQVVFAASECAPWVKSGGLGEVMAALPAAIAALGNECTVYVPFYREVQRSLEKRPDAAEPGEVLRSITVPFPGANRYVRVLDGGRSIVGDGAGSVQTYFLDCPEFFDRDGLYGTAVAAFPDNAERFLLYCRAVLECTKLLGVPDVFHAHDWQAALVPILLRTLYAADPMLRSAATVFTVHNAGYQGQFPLEVLPNLLLPERLYNMHELEAYGEVNLFKGALVFADALTTVSPHYADEIQTFEYGAGLDGVFRERRSVLTGILNGVDYNVWNPAKDGRIAAHYKPADLSGKLECRRDLLHAFSADGTPDDVAVIGLVSRLASQKGFDLLAEILPQLAREKVLLLLLGTGEEHYERLFQRLAAQYPDLLRVQIFFDETIAHKIEAGSDMTLMPSRYEPSGLAQMYSLRYGTVPVVRATGGLEDTVLEGTEGDGFRFREYSGEALLSAIRRALVAFADREGWEAMMRRGMAMDFSWDKPAEAYLRVYEQAMAAAAAR